MNPNTDKELLSLKKKYKNIHNKPGGKWEVVDPNGKVLETFRQKASAKEFLREHSYFGLELELRYKDE